MGNKKRVALVGGAGSWGRHYTRAYAAHPDCEIIALVEKAKDRGERFAAHYAITRVFENVEDLLAEEVPDIVSAILPVEYTHDVVTACARAGVKVVSCEKPLDYQLSRADETVQVCADNGALFGCGTALWMSPHMVQTAAWIQEGHIGAITGAVIPPGLPTEVSGGGCHLLVQLKLLTGLEAEWAEGWLLAPVAKYVATEAAGPEQIDCPAFGRVGLQGGVICELPEPGVNVSVAGNTGITCERGQVWMMNHGPVIIQGSGPEAVPIRPDFLDEPVPEHWIDPVVDRLIKAVDTGDLQCTGHDYRHVLEIAIALTLSAHNDNERVAIPLNDRSHKIYPAPYRLHGGDVTGWGDNSAEPEIVTG